MKKALPVFFSIIYFALQTHLCAKVLTLGEVEHKAVTLGFESRIKYLEQQAKEWEKKNVISNYLPKINYNLNYSRLDDSTVINAGQSLDIFGKTIMDVELIKQVINTITDNPAKNILDPVGQQNEPAGGSANPNAVYKNNLTHEFSFNQPITNGGVEIVAIRIAKLTKKAIDFQIESTKLEAIYNTRKAYFDAIAAIERKKVTKHDLSWNLNNLKKARTKHSTGNIPRTDVLQWEAEVAKKESDVIEAEATVKFLLLNLFNTMGMTDVNIDTIQLQPFEVFEQWYKRGPIPTKCLVDSNYQFKMVQTYTKIAQENKNIALTSFLPKLNGFFTVSYKQGWEKHPTDMFDKDKFRPTWVLGLALNIPLFSGFANPTNFQKSKYEYRKTLIDEQKVRSQFQVNLERIILYYKASYEGIKAAFKQHELMKTQLEIMQKRYDGGLINQSQLLEVSLGVYQTRIGYIHKLFEYLLYEAEYLQNTGKLEVTQ